MSITGPDSLLFKWNWLPDARLSVYSDKHHGYRNLQPFEGWSDEGLCFTYSLSVASQENVSAAGPMVSTTIDLNHWATLFLQSPLTFGKLTGRGTKAEVTRMADKIEVIVDSEVGDLEVVILYSGK